MLDRNLKEADKWLGGSTPHSTYRQCRKVKPPVTVKYNVDKHEAEEARRKAERKKQVAERVAINEGIYMNLNSLAIPGLIMIGIAQVWQAWTALQPTPQETHFRLVQEFCKEKA